MAEQILVASIDNDFEIVELSKVVYTKYYKLLNFKEKHDKIEKLKSLGISRYNTLYYKSIEEINILLEIYTLKEKLKTFEDNKPEDDKIFKFILKKEIKKKQNHDNYIKKISNREFLILSKMYDSLTLY